jgi:hypothetical protein
MATTYSLPDLSGILPARKIKVGKAGFADRWRMLFLALIFPVISFVVVWAWGPGLYADYQIKQDPVVIEDATIFDGNCRTKKMITDCKANISYEYEGERLIKSVDFSFVSFSSGDYETDVVMQKSHPENVTLSLALDEFWNRLTVGVVLLGIMLGCSVLFIKRFLNISKTVGAAKSEAELKLYWAKILSRKDSMGKSRIGYSPLTGVKKPPHIVTVFGKKEAPFFHYDEKSDETFGVVAAHPDGTLPILLDEQLARLELTPEERAKAENALGNLATE